MVSLVMTVKQNAKNYICENVCDVGSMQFITKLSGVGAVLTKPMTRHKMVLGSSQARSIITESTGTADIRDV